MNTIMKAAILPEHGCEEFAKAELEKRFGISSEQGMGYVEFSADPEKISEVIYMAQAAKRIIITLSKGTFEEVDDIIINASEDLENKRVDEFLSGKSFRVECERIGSHDFNSVEVEQEMSAAIKEVASRKNAACYVNLKNPEITIIIRICDNNYIMGVDISGRDLGKRQYAVFNHPNSIRGTLAFSFLMFSGFKPGKSLADPFSLSGTIPIEAALYNSGTSVNYYEKNFKFSALKEFSGINAEEIYKKADKKMKKPESRSEIYSIDASFKNVSAEKKNAKIAGVEKHIEFARKETFDLDLKLFDKKVDILATRMPESSKHFSDNKAASIHKYIFENRKNIVEKNGFLSFIVRDINSFEEELKLASLSCDRKKEVWQGKQKMHFIRIKNI